MIELNPDSFRKNFLKIILSVLILFGFLYILAPFAIAILLGGILAMAFNPFLHSFMKHGMKRKLALILLTFILFLMCLAPVGLVLVRGTKMVSGILSEQSLIDSKQQIEGKIYAFIDNFSDRTHIDPVVMREKFDNFVSNVGAYALNLFSNFLSQIPDILMLSLVTILSFYFFLLHEERIRQWFDYYFYFSDKNGDKFIYLAKSSCKEIFFSNVITGIVQASVIAFGALFCKAGDFFIVFIITFFVSFIPTGAGPIGFILAIFTFLDHRIGAGIAMTCVAAFSGIIDNIIRPYLNSKGSVEVPGFVNFLAIIGGVVMMGLAGLFVGPLLASLTYGALPIILEEWFPENPEIEVKVETDDKTN